MKSFKQFSKEIFESISESKRNTRSPLFHGDVKSGARILADATPKGFDNDYQKSGTAKIIGNRAGTHEQIAAIGQVLRNPKYETFHHIFTKGNEIVGHTAISNRLPSVVNVHKSSHDFHEAAKSSSEQMKNLGADGYYLLHNHPSGNPTPSPQDHGLTQAYKDNLPGFKGHVIVNHKTYVHIHPNSIGKHTTHEISQEKSYDLTQSSLPHYTLGHIVNSPSTIANVGHIFQHPEHATVLARDSSNRILAAANIPTHSLHGHDENSKLKSSSRIRRFIKQTGAGGNVVISVPHDDDVEKLHHLVKSGLAEDIVSHSGKSAKVRAWTEHPPEELGGKLENIKQLIGRNNDGK